MRLIPIIEGGRRQSVRMTVDQVAKEIAEAHRKGQSWDCRIATRGEGYRPLNDEEAKVLVKAVTALL